MRDDVGNFFATCDLRQREKANNQVPAGLLQSLQVPEGLWESVSMDLITSLPETNKGHTCYHCLCGQAVQNGQMCSCTRTCACFCKRNLCKTWHAWVYYLWQRAEIYFFTQLCELLGMRQCTSTAYHPQTGGQTERINRTLEDLRRAYVNPSFTDWDVHLPCCEFAIKNSSNESIRNTPFHVKYGRHPRSPIEFAFKYSARESSTFVQKMREPVEEAQTCMRIAQERQARYANKARRPLEFELGQYVLLDSSFALILVLAKAWVSLAIVLLVRIESFLGLDQ